MDEREKQVEFMADILENTQIAIMFGFVEIGETTLRDRDARRMAEALYDAGCRMQGECENVSRWRGAFECSECHWDCDEADNGETEYKFCPGCGRKVKEKE